MRKSAETQRNPLKLHLFITLTLTTVDNYHKVMLHISGLPFWTQMWQSDDFFLNQM